MTTENGFLKFYCDGLQDCVPKTLYGFDFLSQPFEYVLTVETNDLTTNTKSLIGNSANITMSNGDAEQIINGCISSVKILDFLADKKTLFEIKLKPKFSFFDIEKHSQIFAVSKPMSIVDIVNSVFKQNNFSDIEWQLTKSYPKLNICVQYDETDFNFIQRLLLDAGISYYFKHQQNSHTMVLTDASLPKQGSKQSAKLRNDNTPSASVSRFGQHIGFHSGLFKSQFVDFKQPSSKTTSKKQQPTPLADSDINHYSYGDHHPDSTQDQLDKANQEKLSAEIMRTNYFSGESCFSNWTSATNFNLSNHDDTNLNGDYYVAAIAHQVTSEGILNRFIAYSNQQAFVPMARLDCDDPRFKFLNFDDHAITLEQTQRPHLAGLHPATVVGPKGKSIYTDKYGRVKVQFAWDNEGKFDENSFAWLRVKQPWAGSEYGFYTTPRIGHNVLVSFDHGDPNKPFIIGSITDGKTTPPFTPGKTPWRSGFQSKSLDSNATAPGGHQFIFDDSAKQPTIAIHSQRDMQVNAGNNLTHQIKGGQHTTVTHGDHRQVVNGTLTIQAKKAIHLVNGNSRISVTDSDIIVEADKIDIGAGSGSTPSVKAPALMGKEHTSQDKQQNNNSSDNQSEPNGYPSAQVKITNMNSSITTAGNNYMITATTELNAHLKACNQNSINPLSFDKEGFEIEAKNEIVKVFSNFKFVNSTNLLMKNPSVTLTNDYGVYEFSLNIVSQTEDIKIYKASITKTSTINDKKWTISGEMTIDMTVALSKNHGATGLIPSLAYDLENNLDKISQFLHSVFDNATTTLEHGNPIASVVVVGVIILAAPLGA